MADGVNVFYGVIPLQHSVFSLYNAYNRQPYACPSANEATMKNMGNCNH